MQFGRGDGVRAALAGHGLPSASADGYFEAFDLQTTFMRTAQSYSIVDHRLLRGGYLARLSHESMALYLFLVVVGDREGRSFYGDATICGILRLSARVLDGVRQELVFSGLIRYRRPYWWVLSLSSTHTPQIATKKAPLADRAGGCLNPIRGVVPEAFKALLRSLEDNP